MDQLTLGIGTRLQHTMHGPGVIVGVRYASYLISFINAGVKEAGEALANTMKALEKRACLVANNAGEYPLPSPSIMLTKIDPKNECWLPLLLDWSAKVRPLKIPDPTNSKIGRAHV